MVKAIRRLPFKRQEPEKGIIMKSIKTLLILCIAAILFSSCQPQPAITASPSEVPTSIIYPSETVNGFPAIVATVTATPYPVEVPLVISSGSCESLNGPLPSLSNPEIPASTRPVNKSLGGGLVQNNEFTIELLLYCDSVFQPNADEQFYLSDIGGLAVYYNWRYDGPVQNAGVTGGLTYTFYGMDPDIQLQSGESGGLRQGHISQGRTAGIRFAPNTLPNFSQKALHRFVYIIESPSGHLSGAALVFELKQVSDGVQPGNIVVTPLSEMELQSMEVIKNQTPVLTQ